MEASQTDSFDENRRKHLEFLQNQIARMSSYSFALKGWSVTLVTAILAFMTKDADAPWLVFAPAVPAITFLCLDAYYLALERCFIVLYETAAQSEADEGTKAVAAGSASEPNDAREVAKDGRTKLDLYWMKPKGMGPVAFVKAIVSPAVIGLHGPILAIALIAGGYEFVSQPLQPPIPGAGSVAKVHVIYSWDPPENKKTVNDLVLRLRRNGVDVTFDQDGPAPQSPNPVWMEQQFNEADYVLVMCTPEFRQRFDAALGSGSAIAARAKGSVTAPRPAGGVEYEATLIRNSRYLNRPRPVVIPVLLDGGSVFSIPLVLSGDRYYRGEDEQSFRELLQLLKTPVRESKPE